jgi:redox-sensitive bicupin YhaK (pirin superfamily)
MPSRRRNIDAILIAHLAAGKTRDEAARLCGVDPKTVWRRMQNAAFRDCVQAEREAMVESIRGELRRAGHQAVQTLESLLVADDPKVRLGASKALLSLLLDHHPAPKPIRPEEQGEVIEYVQKVIVSSPEPQAVADDSQC